MKREKILIFLLAACLAVCLGACGSEAAEKGTVQTAVFRNVNASEENTALYEALETALNGAGLIYRKNDAATQTNQCKQITQALENGFGLLIVDLIDADAAGEVAAQAEEAGVGVIFLCQVPEAVLADHEKVCCAALDSEELELTQGRMIGEYLLDHFAEADLNGDGVITYVLLGEDDRALRKAEQVLADGSLAVLRPYETAQEDILADAMLNCSVESNNMVECIIADSGEAARNAAGTLLAAGFNGPAQIRICVFTAGGDDETLAAVAEGSLTGTVYADVETAAETILAMAQVLTGDGALPAERAVTVPHQVVLCP